MVILSFYFPKSNFKTKKKIVMKNQTGIKTKKQKNDQITENMTEYLPYCETLDSSL